MHVHTHLRVQCKTSQYEALQAGSHNCPDITPSHRLMGHIFFAESTSNISLTSKITSAETTLQPELVSSVKWWEIAFVVFHISYISFKSLRHRAITFTHSFLTPTQNSVSSQEQMNLTHKKFWNTYPLTHVSLGNVTEHEVRTHTHTHTQTHTYTRRKHMCAPRGHFDKCEPSKL